MNSPTGGDALQSMLAMANAINRKDIADLLQQNLNCEQQDVRQMQQLLPTLLSQSQQQAA